MTTPTTVLAAATPPVRRRLMVLTAASLLGAVLYLPFLSASDGRATSALWPFVVGATVASGLAAWMGLRIADIVNLPMPLLRAFEVREDARFSTGGLAVAAAAGLAFGLAGVAALRLTGAPRLPGGLLVRILTTPFAAITLEVVLHLFFMSAVVWLARRRVWVGVLASGILLAAFHLAGSTLAPAVQVASVLANGGAGVLFGWLYSRYGFEYAVIAHAIAHLCTLSLG